MASGSDGDGIHPLARKTLFMGMLPLEFPVPLSAKELTAEFSRLYPRLPYPVRISPGENETSIVAMIDDAMVGVMMMDLPMPPGSLDKALTGNMLWPDAAATVSRQRAHVIVTAMRNSANHAGAMSNAMAVTLIASALAHLLPCLGLYWGAAETLVPPERARAAGLEVARGEVPFDLWVRFYFKREDAAGTPRLGTLSRGLLNFVDRELEISPVAMSMVEVGQRAIGMAGQLIQHGPIYLEGQTAGFTEQERFRIRHVDSSAAVGLPVIMMTLEQPPAPPPSALSAHNNGPLSTPATRGFGRRTTPVKGN
jgi:hypothetical protein